MNSIALHIGLGPSRNRFGVRGRISGAGDRQTQCNALPNALGPE